MPSYQCCRCEGKGRRQCDRCGCKCPSCKGTLVYSPQCSSCAGAGRSNCRSCSVTGRRFRIQCFGCRGAGWIICAKCNGRGKGKIVECKGCNRSGKNPSCQVCHGSGLGQCMNCSGSGRVELANDREASAKRLGQRMDDYYRGPKTPTDEGTAPVLRGYRRVWARGHTTRAVLAAARAHSG